MKRIIIYILTALLVFAMVFGSRKYCKYRQFKNEINNINVSLEAWLGLMAYHSENNGNLPTKNEFKGFLDKNKIEKNFLNRILDIYDFNIIYKNDSIYIYSYGFDGKNNHGNHFYWYKDFRFFHTIFKTGDMLLMSCSQCEPELMKLDSLSERKRIYDNSPKPPDSIRFDSLMKDIIYKIKSLEHRIKKECPNVEIDNMYEQ